MKTIREYLDSLFLSVPRTPETQRAKEDLLATMEDRYQELINEGKSENEAVGAVINEFGSIDELLNELELSRENQEDESDYGASISFQEAELFFDEGRRFAFYIAAGVLSISLGVSVLTVLARSSLLAIIGLLFLLLLTGIGIGFFIMGGLRYHRIKKELDDRRIPEDIQAMASERVQQYTRSFALSLIAGIFFILAGLSGVTISGIFRSEWVQEAGAFFIASSGIGTFLIIYGSVTYAMYRKLASKAYFVSVEDEPGPRAAKNMYGENYETVQRFEKLYWPVILVMYFLWSFVFGAWAYSWILFPIGGILGDWIKELLGISKKKK